MDFDIKVDTKNPFADGSAQRMLVRTNRNIELDVVKRAHELIHQRLPRVLQNPTGHYQSTVDIVYAADPYVDGDGTVYGAWLEGVSTRNASTRFKGYHTFRLMTQKAEREAESIGERHLDRLARVL